MCLMIITLCAGRTCLVHGIHQRGEVFIKLIGIKRNLANGNMDIGCLVKAELNTTSFGFLDRTSHIIRQRQRYQLSGSASDHADRAHVPSDRPCPSHRAWRSPHRSPACRLRSSSRSHHHRQRGQRQRHEPRLRLHPGAKTSTRTVLPKSMRENDHIAHLLVRLTRVKTPCACELQLLNRTW